MTDCSHPSWTLQREHSPMHREGARRFTCDGCGCWGHRSSGRPRAPVRPYRGRGGVLLREPDPEWRRKEGLEEVYSERRAAAFAEEVVRQMDRGTDKVAFAGWQSAPRRR